ncbi:lymphocyte antigen 75-like [Syngnathus typhle]|uniref:lymphocyte antigen 75-like n=1 Tax=Syngnathus typhle TaxID=161592 RepID=UPI002A69AA4D|nr:lymphocyte antigen 75-like [Syngnathus typhle]
MKTPPAARLALVLLSCVVWMLYSCAEGTIKTCDTDNGWTHHGSHCYKKMETTNGWLGARYDCVLEGADLVSFTDKNEQDFVKGQMGDKPFWIGLSNLNCNDEGCWFFEAGEKELTWSKTSMTPDYTNWNTRQKGSSNVESCAYVNQGAYYYSQRGKWRHGSCRSSLAYMCERPLDTCSNGRTCSRKASASIYYQLETSFCDSGHFLYKDSCYYFEGPRSTWQPAEDFCKNKGGHLASVHSQVDGEFLAAHAQESWNWLGLKRNNGKYEWSDRSTTNDVPWHPNGKHRDCAQLFYDGQVYTFPCSGVRQPICQKGKARDLFRHLPVTTSASGTIKKCDAKMGWTLHGSHCYKKMDTTNGWLGARHDCLWEGGDLVSITSTDEEDFVKRQMGDRPFWIGLSNLNCKDEWCQFLDAGAKELTWSSTSMTPDYTNWDTRQKGSLNVESCAYVNQGVDLYSQPGKWRHGSCQSSLAYMCEWSPDDCPDGWPCSYKDLGYRYNRVETSFCDAGEFLYKDSCYHFEGRRKTWQEAERFCKNKGGHLASLHSLVVGQFLFAHVRRDGQGWLAWLGLRKNNGNFEWSDTSCPNDVPWYNSDRSSECSKLAFDGNTHLTQCNDLRPSICRKGKAREFLPLLLTPTSASGESAKCGWWQENPANDFCYLINSKPTKTWKEARDKCARLSGNLLGFADSQEHAFIQGLLPKASSVWLDTTVEDGSEQSAQSSPNSVQLAAAGNPSDPSGRRCNALLGVEGGREVGDCEKKRGYVCKRRVVQTCETNKGWRRFGSNCYKKMETTNGWLGARYDCVWEGGDLVSITSPYEQSFVTEQMGDKPFWIGLSNLNCDKTWCQFFEAGQKRLTWSNTAVTLNYVNWRSGQDGSASVGSCAYVNQGVHSSSQPGKWRHGSCGSSLPYMCKRSPDDCPVGRLCSYKDYGFGYNRVETSASFCDPGDFLYKGSCYHFWEKKRTWEDAEKFCRESEGHLASVHSLDEVKFLAGHMPYKEGLQSWVGLKKHDIMFEWSDATPAGNIEWVPHGPIGRGDCAALSLTGKLEDWPCTDILSFICKKAKVQDFLLPPPAGQSEKCGWWQDRPSSDFCYLIQHRPTKAWKEARDDCLRHGGDLLSIADSSEQAFIQSLYAFLPSAPSLWLGINNNITKDGSGWTDGSPLGYAVMDEGDPSGASCLSLLTSNGRWKFDDCRKKTGYICKKRGNILEPPQQPHDVLTDPKATCDISNGWNPHASKCYKKMEKANGWLGARHDCLWEGGDLVSISSIYEESFVKKQMGDKPFWIGLSNLDCNKDWCQFFEEGEKKLTWSDTGVTPAYANRDSRQDGSSNIEACAYVNQGVHSFSQPGKWRHGSCGSSLAYMCKRSPDACTEGQMCSYKDYGLGYSREETSYCDPGDFLYKGSCYHFGRMERTWKDAEKFCQEWKGHLASVLSWDEGKFLAAHAANVGGLQSWVGLKKNNGNFEWSDATPAGKIEWVPNRPAGRGDCVALSQTGKLEDWPCTNIQPFICKKAKVHDFLLPPPPGRSAKCGWWLERPSSDFCYLIQRKPTKTWEEARDDCLRRGGDLLSIADSHEQAFIQSLHTLLPSAPSLWLGVDNNVTKDGSKWIDGSPFVYIAMDRDDPGDLSGASCLSLLTSNGRWKFDDCRKKGGYICKKRGNIPKAPQQPHDVLADRQSPCDTVNGWSSHGSKCYKKMEKTNGWLGARYDCVWEGGNLVSITSSYEESFVKKQMGDKPFWIGLSNLNCDEAWCQFSEAGEKLLTWSDTGVTPTYTNRDSRQDGSASVGSCAYVNQGVHDSSQPGKWRHGSCGSSLPYMCERSPDACPVGRLCSYKDYGLGYHRVETSYCDTGDFLYKGSCYHFEGVMRTWEGAETFCGIWKGHLASVLSSDEGKFLAAHAPYVGGFQSWVGLKKNEGNFEWSDATPTGKIEWVPDRPAGRGDCASLSQTGQLEDRPCTNARPFICKKAKVRDFLLTPLAGWSAKCGWWQDRPSSDFCYLIQRWHAKAWTEARDDCLRRGGDLLSITDSQEQAFIQSLDTFLPSALSLWLGVSNNITKDGSGWTDGSPLGYVVMDGGDPGDLSSASCLSLLTSNGRWKFDNCQKKRGYMCKKRGNTPKAPRPHDGFKEILVCNKHSADLVCEAEGQKESRISIQSAFYGRRSDDVCQEDGDSFNDHSFDDDNSLENEDTCSVEGIVPRYRKMCNSQQKCHIEVLEDKSCPAPSNYLQMVYSCEQKVCLDSLGIADGSVADSSFKASSSMEDATPEKARLNGESCWKPSKNALGSWILVNLGYTRKVTAIVTQGCNSTDTRSWDIPLEMRLSVDKKKWNKHPDGKFIGGGTHLLETPGFAQYVRILPLENRPEFGLRFDILGCPHEDKTTCARKFNSLRITDWITFYCPPGCAKYFVAGTLVYSEDSHICAAAIHAGVIRNDIGGDCIVMGAPKQQIYTGSTGNGITSGHLNDPLGVSHTFADGEPRCAAPDWEEFAGFCYKTFEGKKKWDDAQLVCRSLGAELVSIRSEMEQASVKNVSHLETSDMWTGLNDLALPGTLVWSDRHEVTFTHWAAGEPIQRVGLDKHCVAVLRQTGRWKRMSCAQVNSFMCKMPTAHFPIASPEPLVAP